MTQKKYKPTQPYGGVDAGERRETRRDAFIEAGLEAFGTTGYVRSTIKEICQTAGLTQRYLYESFRDKEDLLVAVYRKLIRDIEEESRIIFDQPGISPEDKARKVLTVFYQRFKDNPRRAQVQLFEILGVSPRVDKEYQAAMQTLADWIRIMMDTVSPELRMRCAEPAILFTGLAGAVIQIAQHWVLDELKMPVAQIVDHSLNIFLTLGKHYTGQAPGD